MKLQLACVVFIFLACHGTCSDGSSLEPLRLSPFLRGTEVNPRHSDLQMPDDNLKREAREDQESRLFSSKIHSLSQQGQGAWLGDWERLLARESPPALRKTLEGLYHLQSLCRMLQTGEPLQGALQHKGLNQVESKENIAKRKSPYILKRHLHSDKPRRPYLLKRQTVQ